MKAGLVSNDSTDSETGYGAVGNGEYRIKQGEDLATIAWQRGHDLNTIWNHADNAEVKEKRENPEILKPGDRIHIPDIEGKQESGGTEQRHSFRRKGAPPKLSMRFLLRDEPRSDQPYRINVPGQEIIQGTLDGDGAMEQVLPFGVDKVTIYVGEPEFEERFELTMGGLDPVTELTGLQSRLLNLGYACPQNGELDEGTQGALNCFQTDHDLEVTGHPDDATRQAILDAHGR